MAQHDYVIANGTGSAVRSDLNNALAAIVSQNSGASEPSPTFAFQLWADTTTNTLKLRNSANSAWIELRQLDGDFTKVSVDNGTAGAPSIYFNASGTDTGFYSSGTDALDFSTAGTRRLGIASGGDLTVYGGNVTLNAQGDLRFADSDSSNWVAFQSPATVSSNVTWTLPSADGTNGQALTTNGSGTLSWTSPTSTTDKITEGNTEAEVVDTGSDGHFKVTTEGTERLRVDSSGRVGIGSTSPSTVLHCESAQAEVNIKSTSGTNSAGVRFVPGGQTNAWYIYANGNRNLVFDDHASERMRIDASGRLLVGTSSTFANGNTDTPGVIFGGGSTVGNGLGVYRFTNDTNWPIFSIGRAQTATVGGQGAIAGSSTLGGIFFDGSDGSAMRAGATILAVNDQGGAWASGDCPARLVFSTTADGASSPTERMRITSAGFFKASNSGSYFGSTGTYHEIRSDANGSDSLVVSSSNSSGPIGLGVYFTAASPNGTGNFFVNCEDSTTRRAAIRSNGGLANFSANNVNLSDRNAKKDIALAAGTWDCLKEWEIVNFRYKDQPDDADLNMGVIAQQVAESCPEVITVFQEAKEATETEPAQEERLGVKEQQMYWMAIKALQEAQLRIETLEAEVAALKAS